MINDLKLVCLTSGKKKDGIGDWYRATFLGHGAEGKPVTGQFYIPSEVGEKMVREGIVEDVPVVVSFGLDDFMRPAVQSVSRASGMQIKKSEV